LNCKSLRQGALEGNWGVTEGVRRTQKIRRGVRDSAGSRGVCCRFSAEGLAPLLSVRGMRTRRRDWDGRRCLRRPGAGPICREETVSERRLAAILAADVVGFEMLCSRGLCQTGKPHIWNRSALHVVECLPSDHLSRYRTELVLLGHRVSCTPKTTRLSFIVWKRGDGAGLLGFHR